MTRKRLILTDDHMAHFKSLLPQKISLEKMASIIGISVYGVQQLRQEAGIPPAYRGHHKRSNQLDTELSYDHTPHIELCKVWKGVKHYPVVSLISRSSGDLDIQ